MPLPAALITLLALLILVPGCRSGQGHAPTADAAASADAAVPNRAEDVTPLDVGQTAPTATLRTVAGESVDLKKRFAERPTALIFYRGGWCPYCTRHLSAMVQVEPKLVEMGYQVLAISPDRPEALQSTLGEHELKYQLLSDADMALAKAFGLAFRVDDATVVKYHGYGIDLEKASGHDHHLLPVPAVYLINPDGTIRFAHWDPDYRQRLDPDEVLAAAK